VVRGLSFQQRAKLSRLPSIAKPGQMNQITYTTEMNSFSISHQNRQLQCAWESPHNQPIGHKNMESLLPGNIPTEYVLESSHWKRQLETGNTQLELPAQYLLLYYSFLSLLYCSNRLPPFPTGYHEDYFLNTIIIPMGWKHIMPSSH
jgi:hypothetical protein